MRVIIHVHSQPAGNYICRRSEGGRSERSDSVNDLRLTSPKSVFFSAATCVLAVVGVAAPLLVSAQCSPMTASAASKNPASPGSSAGTTTAGAPEFFDEPQFIVAGVTDASTPGGHGSDTVVRTKEALAKDTASLSGDAAGSHFAGGADAAVEKSLRAALE